MKSRILSVLYLLVVTNCYDDPAAPSIDVFGGWTSHDPLSMSIELDQAGSVLDSRGTTLSGHGALFACDACASPPVPVDISGSYWPPNLHFTIAANGQNYGLFQGTVVNDTTIAGVWGGEPVTFRRVVSCTEVGCSDGFSLMLRPAATRFPAGRYDVRVARASAPTDSCFFVVSDDPTACVSGHCITSENCNGLYTMGAGPGDEVEIRYPVIEATLDVEIRRDGVAVANAVFEPTYQVVRPNGLDCPPRCNQGSYEIVVP